MEKRESFPDPFEKNKKEEGDKPIKQEPLEERFIMNDAEQKWIGGNHFEEIGNSLYKDFELLLSENPPLKEEFSPQEEIQRIKKLPREERREALSIFKNKLERQREGWAKCRNFLEKIIEFDNDPPRDYLLEWVHLFGKNYGFTEEHYNLTEEIIDAFYEEREKCLKFLNIYHDNPCEAVSELTGVEFKNKENVDVDAGAVAVNIGVGGKEYKKISKKEDLPRDTSGFFKVDLFTYIGFNVIKKEGDSERIKIHEEEHSKNELLFRYLHAESNSLVKKAFLSADLEKEKDEKKKEEIFRKYIKIFQKEALLRAKNEILAYKKDGSDIDSSMFFSPLYDYFKVIKEKYSGRKEEALVNEVLVEEYKEIIDRAIMAFNVLESKGYTTDEVIALLGDKKLSKWPKTIQRIIEQRR